MIKENERLDEINDSLRLIQKKNGLTFGTDAYLLYAYMKRKPNAVAVDLGAGTGIISLLSLNRNKFRSVHAVEVQESFADLIERNAAINSLSDRLFVHHTDLRDTYATTFGGEVDVVFSNPPYMTAESGYHNESVEKLIARHEIMGGIVDFCRAANRLLKYGGSFYVVYRTDRLTDLLAALRQEHLEIKRMTFVHGSEKHPPSFVLLEAKKGGAVGLFVTKPLLLKNAAGEDSADVKSIYENGEFDKAYERP